MGGITESRNHGITDLRNYGITSLNTQHYSPSIGKAGGRLLFTNYTPHSFDLGY